MADAILRTRLDLEVDGDTYAPDLGDGWVVTSTSGWQTSESGLRYVVEELVRTGQASRSGETFDAVTG